jgi:hypothetical protein
MKPTKKKSTEGKRSVSFKKELCKAAEARAKSLNRNFSNYIQTLVQADLESAKTT